MRPVRKQFAVVNFPFSRQVSFYLIGSLTLSIQEAQATIANTLFGTTCPANYPYCGVGRNCVISACKNGLASGCMTWIRAPDPSMPPGPSNYIDGHDSAGNHCTGNYQVPTEPRQLQQQERWSDLSARARICPAGETGDCMVQKDTELLVDASMDVGSLTIKGSVTWETSSDDLQLKAGFVVVEGTSGSFQVGTPQQPMLNRATIYLKDNGKADLGNGKRFFGAVWRNDGGNGAGPSVRLHGRPLKHTWTLLVSDVARGARTLRVQHDVVNDDASLAGGGAWKIGDTIGVAPTGLPVTSPRDTHAGEKFTIASLQTESLPSGTITVIGLSAGLNEPKLGDVARRMQAEVINLNRNILITGDDFDSSDHGLHVRIANGLSAPVARGGIMQIQYSRVEKCGQRGVLGKYCLHFHVMGDCGPSANAGTEPRCLFRGNVVEDSQQRGIVVHGTHRSLVDQNVLWNVRGAGIYIEDGNEMANVISENVNICPDSSFERQNCNAKGTDNVHADDIHQSGMWALSPSNDFLRNRMVNHMHGFFLQTSAFTHGKGLAQGKVCTQHLPFGRFEGNVHHSNWRFGFYPDNNFPRRVKRSIASNGMVEDMQRCLDGNDDTWCSCEAFTHDGKDNGAPAVIADDLDWGNNFVGAYELGDVQYLRYHSINNLHGLYWKQTKNFATLGDIGAETWSAGSFDGPSGLGTLPTSHLKGCTFEFFSDVSAIMGSPHSGVALTLGPGGHGAFIVEHTRYSGSAGVALASNQHCGVGPGTGGLCTPEYQLVNVSFSGLSSSTKWIQFGISQGDVRLPSYSSFDSSLDGYKGVAPAEQTHLLKTASCRLASSVSADAAIRFDDGILCDKPLRRLQLWRGQQTSAPQLSLTAVPGSEQSMFYVLPPSGGHEHRTKKGYGAVVIPGLAYTLSNLEALPGDAYSGTTLEFSDDAYGNVFGNADLLPLTLISTTGQQRSCDASSQHDRRFIGRSGPLRSGYGECLPGGTSHPPLSTVSPRPASTSTSLPPTAGPATWTSQTCSHRSSWPKPLKACSGYRLEGITIRSDGGLNLCIDCAERCFFQMPSCVGYTFKANSGQGSVTGTCTYVSSITSVIADGSGGQVISVTTSDLAAALTTTTAIAHTSSTSATTTVLATTSALATTTSGARSSTMATSSTVLSTPRLTTTTSSTSLTVLATTGALETATSGTRTSTSATSSTVTPSMPATSTTIVAPTSTTTSMGATDPPALAPVTPPSLGALLSSVSRIFPAVMWLVLVRALFS